MIAGPQRRARWRDPQLPLGARRRCRPGSPASRPCKKKQTPPLFNSNPQPAPPKKRAVMQPKRTIFIAPGRSLALVIGLPGSAFNSRTDLKPRPRCFDDAPTAVRFSALKLQYIGSQASARPTPTPAMDAGGTGGLPAKSAQTESSRLVRRPPRPPRMMWDARSWFPAGDASCLSAGVATNLNSTFQEPIGGPARPASVRGSEFSTRTCRSVARGGPTRAGGLVAAQLLCSFLLSARALHQPPFRDLCCRAALKKTARRRGRPVCVLVCCQPSIRRGDQAALRMCLSCGHLL